VINSVTYVVFFLWSASSTQKCWKNKNNTIVVTVDTKYYA